jgi:hypothetical protein
MTYIYKLKINGKSYVGSTNHINNRMINHKNNCYNQNLYKYNYKLYKMIRENGGWNNVDIHIIQECNELIRFIIEDYYIEHFKCEMNSVNAIFNVEKRKKYYEKWAENNLEHLQEYRKNYKKQNEERINNYQSEYRKNHIEERKEYDKIRYTERKKIMLEKVKCICGCIVTNNYLKQHQKTKKHQQYLQNLSSSLVLSSSSSSAV